MSTVLAIKAHPLSGEGSRSMKIFEQFLAEYTANHPEDEIIFADLYDEEIPEINGELLSAWQLLRSGSDFNDLTPNQQHLVRNFNHYTEQFLAADKIVIGNALWNLNIPTRLKAWFDTICVAGTTFKYTENGPVGLVTGKKALHIQASGGIYQGQDFASQYVESMLNFIGIEDVTRLAIEGIDYHPEQEGEIMAEASRIASELAASF